ncbi:MAG TPA: ADP-glyceromanno-heptose 6-epimerase [Candidatus Binataceae bacterium]|nr:ADP-glyceromanno-heptose 6-epimerase [Candidatus Binataceae bacterium]
MLIVTGGAGFIGSNLLRALNQRGDTDILVVDRIGANFRNLSDLRFSDFMEPEAMLRAIERGATPPRIEAIFHQGACADTTESDGHYMMENNFSFSRELLAFALARRAPFVYASSASVYGANRTTLAEPANERPLNLYALSKLAFDNHVRHAARDAVSTVVGLRYFNVYGPREAHKGNMASMAYQLFCQLRDTGVARLFAGTDGYGDGEQRRDFVFVEDVVKVNLHFTSAPPRQQIINVGTGKSRSFNEMARILIDLRGGQGGIEYVAFDERLRGKYQSFTEADLTALRTAGYSAEFTALEQGLAQSITAWK